MDKEDESTLFDTERVKRELSFEFVKQLQLALTAYTQSGREGLDTHHSEIALAALQDAVAELMVKHNRVLWQAAQQLLLGELGSSNQ